jgi:rare lipoprotein A
MGRVEWACAQRIARAIAVVCTAGALNGCSSAERIIETRMLDTPIFETATNNTTNTAAKESSYSRRIAQQGETVPRGGGRYKLGKPYMLNGRTYVPNDDPNYTAEGLASWYGPDFHGRETANGEVFDMNSISAAHPTLPMPSYVRVTNLTNDRSIIVRVNDRGPYVANRIIDLSVATAKALDFHSKGVARVRVEYVGRAKLEGSDDKMLLATLRQGSPAPVPSQIRMLASNNNLPGAATGGTAKTANTRVSEAMAGFPTDRTSGRGQAKQEQAKRTVARARTEPTANTDRRRALVKLPDGPVPAPAMSASGTTGFSTRWPDSVGFVSGRGLY